MQNKINRLNQHIDAETYEKREAEIKNALELVQSSDKAGYLPDETLMQLRELGGKTAPGPHGDEGYLTQEESICLSVRKGTLTDEERGIMEGHVSMTRRMLSEMSFPNQFRFVPGWASAHHEHLNGQGYPDGLMADEIPDEVRILTIIDVYDALTARDRPYKPAITPEDAFVILEDMANCGQIDARLLQLFKRSEVWKESARC